MVDRSVYTDSPLLGFVPVWKVTHMNAEIIMPRATQGFIEEAVQGDVDGMEGPAGLRIERVEVSLGFLPLGKLLVMVKWNMTKISIFA